MLRLMFSIVRNASSVSMVMVMIMVMVMVMVMDMLMVMVKVMVMVMVWWCHGAGDGDGDCDGDTNGDSHHYGDFQHICWPYTVNKSVLFPRVRLTCGQEPEHRRIT